MRKILKLKDRAVVFWLSNGTIQVNLPMATVVLTIIDKVLDDKDNIQYDKINLKMAIFVGD